MNKSVLCFLTVVIVSARCSAESIPALSKTSGIAVAHSTQTDEQKIRVNNEAVNEERENFAIESFTSYVKNADESLSGTTHAASMMDLPQMKETGKALALHEANMMNVPHIKEHNKVLATRMEKLGINIDGVVFVAKASEKTLTKFSLNNLEWMVLGKVYFEKAGSNHGYIYLRAKTLFKEAKMKIVDNEKMKKWAERVKNFQVRAERVFGKMLWLIRHQDELNLNIADAAKMAFGSEYLNKRTLPIPGQIIKVVTEQNIDKDVMESLIRKPTVPKKPKQKQIFPIESFTSLLKIADESLPRGIDAESTTDVSHIKEHNKVLATRMDKLGIDIDGVVFVTKVLESEFDQFSLNNLEWMVLGKLYFKKAGSSTGYRVLRARELFKEVNMEISDNDKMKKWTKKLLTFEVGAYPVFGKMLWLIRHQDELNLNLADAAKMAFGSEFLTKKTLPIPDSIIEAVAERNVDNDVTESEIWLDEDSTMNDIAGVKRKYVDEESQEQLNKNRKLE